MSKRSVFTLFIVGALLLFIQSCFFGYLLSGRPHLESADMIIAFEGRDGRAGAAYMLADHRYAPVLVISPATDRKLRVYDRRFRPKHEINRIIEEKARTTFENALYTGRIVRANHFQKVILVTSWNHMPRSYILLRIMLTGANVRIQPYAVATGIINSENWYRHMVGWKMIYNEMLESWGSIAELINYRVSGTLPGTRMGKTGFISQLKDILLFEIDPIAMARYSS